MRFVSSRTELQRALQIAIQAASSQSPLPIYRNVLMQAGEDRLSLMSYNGDVGFQVNLPVRVEEPGDATAPAKLLSDIVGALPDADVAVESGPRETVTIRCQKSEFSLAGEPADQFPLLPEVETVNRLVLPAPLLRELISQTTFAVAHDESRPALTGVSLAVKDNKIEAASTDTHRLSIREITVPEMALAPDTEVRVILPERTLEQFAKVIPADAQDTVELRLSTRQALLQYRDVAVVSRLIEGQFPNYERVIPASYEKLLTLDREPFLKAVKRVSLIADRETAKRIILRASHQTLSLTAEVGGVGHAREEIDLPGEVEGGAEADGEIELAFNADYLLDVLSEIKSTRVRLEVSGRLTPCVIRGDQSTEYRYILMPMQIA